MRCCDGKAPGRLAAVSIIVAAMLRATSLAYLRPTRCVCTRGFTCVSRVSRPVGRAQSMHGALLRPTPWRLYSMSARVRSGASLREADPPYDSEELFAEVTEPETVTRDDEEAAGLDAVGIPSPDLPKRVHFVIEGDPQPLRRHRVANNRMYNPSYADQRRFLELAGPCLPPAPLLGPIEATLVFKMRRPRTHYRAGRYSHLLKPSAPRFHTGRIDLDNLIKMVLDSVNEHAYADDRQIVSVRAMKEWCNVGRGSTEVTFQVLDDGTREGWWDEGGGVESEDLRSGGDNPEDLVEGSDEDSGDQEDSESLPLSTSAVADPVVSPVSPDRSQK